jgi:hypothetical protein
MEVSRDLTAFVRARLFAEISVLCVGIWKGMFVKHYDRITAPGIVIVVLTGHTSCHIRHG